MDLLLLNSTQIFIGLATILMASTVIWLIKRHKEHQMFKKYGIPGPEPNLITGSMMEVLAVDNPNTLITEWIKKYGNVFGYFVGGYPRLIVNDVDIIKTLFIKEFRKFSNREVVPLKVLPFVHSVISLRDERWKKVRSILTPTFSSSKIRQMTDIINIKVDKMLQIIEELSSKNQSFDMYIRVQGLTLDVIGECALALKVNCQQDSEDPLLLAVRDFFRHSNNSAVKVALCFPPLILFMEFVANYLKAGRMTSMIVDNLKEVIAYRRTQKGPKANDLLQLMLDSSAEQSSINKDNFLTDIEIISNAYIFLLAGYETTATALAFSFFLLAKHQDIQERLYEEIKTKVGDKQYPSYEDVSSMQYLDQVFSECLRYYPPVTGFVSRECGEEYEINGFKIPKGVAIQASVWDIHHDPELWPDPWKFDPERFSPENKSNTHPCSFLPFGLGPRNCVGMRFALIEAKLAITRTVLNYKLKFCEETDESLQLICPSVIINPKNGVFLKAERR